MLNLELSESMTLTAAFKLIKTQDSLYLFSSRLGYQSLIESSILQPTQLMTKDDKTTTDTANFNIEWLQQALHIPTL